MKKYRYKGAITVNGIQYRIYADTKSELEAKKAIKRREILEGCGSSNGDMTLNSWAKRCVSAYKLRMAEITRIKYERKMQIAILQYIGHLPLNRITPLDCQRVMGLLDGKSDSYIRDITQMLHFLFSKAVQNRLIESDPTVGITKPRSKPTEHRRALTPEERSAVEAVGATSRRYYIWLLMLYCGCRPGEAAECKGSDITTVNGVNMLHIRGTKNRFSDRFVPIPDRLYSLIKNTPKTEYIACTGQGNKIDSNRKRTWDSFKHYLDIELGATTYRNAVIKSKLADDLFPYCLRHEYCTDLARKGVDIRIAQRLMGHSNINMTANVYTNLDAKDIASVAHIITG